MSQDLHQQPCAVPTRTRIFRERLLRRLHASLHADEIADFALQPLIESNQEVDGILAIAGDRGEERRQPRADRLGIEIRRKLLGELGGIGERESFREGFDEEIERIYHRHVGDEIDRNGEFASLLWKDEACEPVSIRILLPVHEVLRRRDFERVAFDPRAAMGGRAQPNDLRREADRPVVAVPCDVVEAGEDRHTLSCYTKTAFILRDFAMQFLDRLAPPRSRGAAASWTSSKHNVGAHHTPQSAAQWRLESRRSWAAASAAEYSAPRGRHCRGQTCV